MRTRIFAVVLAGLLLAGCGRGDAPISGRETVNEAEPVAPIATDEYFTARDRAGDYDAASAIPIELKGDTAVCTSKAVKITQGGITVVDEGVYILRGDYAGTVTVDAEKSDKVQLVLDGVSITSATSAALYIRQADKVFLTLAAGSENRLANGGGFTAIDENNIDAAIFARDDLTLNGSGALVIDSPAGHGVAAKDELIIAGGSCTVTAAGHGFSANDCICLSGAVLNVTAGKDGLKAEHDEDASLGFIVVERGEVTVTADGDGLSASAYLQIADGEFTLTTGGGHKAVSHSGGGDWSFGGRGFWQSGAQADDTVSAKGIKAGGDLLIAGGKLTVDAADDALHSNANLTVSGGMLTLASGDDGIHADAAAVVAGGVIDITASYEGLEGLSITVSGGECSLVASDDGLNAAGGADASGFGGFFGGGGRGGMPGGEPPEGNPGGMPGGAPPEGMPGDSFAAGGEGDMFILISGGRLEVNAGGDGIDSNGTLIVRGGETYVAGPTNGGNGPLDYQQSASVSGGIFIAVGSAGMAQNFSSAERQGALMANVSGAAGSEILLTDASGAELLRWVSPKSYSSVVISCPGLTEGGKYTLTCGGTVTEIVLDQLIAGGMGGMGGGRPGEMPGQMPGGMGGGRPERPPEFGGNPSDKGGRGGRN